MKEKLVYVLGVRGFPNVQGGIETHSENIYPRISKAGYKIVVLGRAPYLANIVSGAEYQGVTMKKLWSPTSTGIEAFVHTFIGVLYSIIKRPSILHIHAIGPAFFTPLARLFGLKVVVTHHGFDYEREKWGRLPKLLLRAGEYLALKFANKVIAVSDIAATQLQQAYDRKDVVAISNGVDNKGQVPDESLLTQFGLEKHKYFLSVSRVVEEKRQIDLIRAFTLANIRDYPLVIVGSGGGGPYYNIVSEAAEKISGVKMLGQLSGQTLISLYHYAGAFVHASSIEGNPIVLLEAMSFGLPIITSNIPANKEINLAPEEYFSLGDIQQLSDRMLAESKKTFARDMDKVNRIKNEFSWDVKAKETVAVYDQIT